jgi:hypothetical protein
MFLSVALMVLSIFSSSSIIEFSNFSSRGLHNVNDFRRMAHEKLRLTRYLNMTNNTLVINSTQFIYASD